MTIKLIVGLGNPGNKYQHNRHNIGAVFLTSIAVEKLQTLNDSKAFFGQVAKTSIANHRVYLLKPNTFMNCSGQSVVALMNFYKINPDEILILHDELDITLGTARLKFGGGHGGHNGLRDIISHLSSSDFYRLRLGIGRPPAKMAVTDFVLQNFSKTQKDQVTNMINDCYRVLDKIVSGEINNAMQILHT